MVQVTSLAALAALFPLSLSWYSLILANVRYCPVLSPGPHLVTHLQGLIVPFTSAVSPTLVTFSGGWGGALFLEGPALHFGEPPPRGPCRAGQQHAPPRGNPACGEPPPRPPPEWVWAESLTKGTDTMRGEVVAVGPCWLLCAPGAHQTTPPAVCPKKDRDPERIFPLPALYKQGRIAQVLSCETSRVFYPSETGPFPKRVGGRPRSGAADTGASLGPGAAFAARGVGLLAQSRVKTWTLVVLGHGPGLQQGSSEPLRATGKWWLKGAGRHLWPLRQGFLPLCPEKV